MRKAILLLCWLALPALAGDLDLDLRYRTNRSYDNAVEPTAIYSGPLFSWLEGSAGARASITPTNFDALNYKGELRVPLVGGFSVGARVYQANLISQSTAATQLLLKIDGSIFPFSFLGIEAGAGWQERVTAVAKTIPLPFLSRTSFAENDFAYRLGIIARPLREWSGAFRLTNYEQLDAYNLNSPFFELEGSYRPVSAAWSAYVFSRYRVWLGFGRQDELMFGGGLKLVLERVAVTTPAPSDM